MDGLDVVNLVLEIVGWVGVVGGITAFAISLVAHAADNSWSEVSVVVLHDDRGAVARWLTTEGMHERELTEHEVRVLGDPDTATAWSNTGGRLRVERRSHLLKAWWTISSVLLGVGVLALAASLIIEITASD